MMHRLILEALQELVADLKKRDGGNPEKTERDYRTDPLWLKDKRKYLLVDKDKSSEEETVLEKELMEYLGSLNLTTVV